MTTGVPPISAGACAEPRGNVCTPSSSWIGGGDDGASGPLPRYDKCAGDSHTLLRRSGETVQSFFGHPAVLGGLP